MPVLLETVFLSSSKHAKSLLFCYRINLQTGNVLVNDFFDLPILKVHIGGISDIVTFYTFG